MAKYLYYAVFLFALFYYFLHVEVEEGVDVADYWNTKIFVTSLQLFSYIKRVRQLFIHNRHDFIRSRNLSHTVLNFLLMGRTDGVDHTGLEVWDAKLADVPVRFYKRSGVGDHSYALIYFHGGGFIYNTPVYSDSITTFIANGTDFLVISVDYRLAPEFPFPAAYNDVMSVCEYVVNNHMSLHVKSSQIIVAGDSAGGNLATVVSQKLTKDKVKLQVLLNPFLQIVDFSLPSHLHSNSYLKNLLDYFTMFYLDGPLDKFLDFKAKLHLRYETKLRISKIMNISKYLPDSNESENEISKSYDKDLVKLFEHKVIDPQVSPLLFDDLYILPSAYIVTCSNDPLRSEGIMYVNRLKEAGVKVVHEDYIGEHQMMLFSTGPLKLKQALKSLHNLVTFLINETQFS